MTTTPPATTYGPTSSRVTRRDLRLASGLVLFAYIALHLANHALGLVSIAAAERATLARIGAADDVRLACQLGPDGDIAVVPPSAPTTRRRSLPRACASPRTSATLARRRAPNADGAPRGGIWYVCASFPQPRACRPMSKAALYSQSGRTRKAVAPPGVAGAGGATPAGPDTPPPDSPRPASRARRFGSRWQRPLLVAAGGIAVLAAVALHALLAPGARQLTQEDIDAAVLHSLETNRMPSAASKAYEAVRRSVVRVRGTSHDKGKDGKPAEGVGSGVVIVDTGIILTNMHVVAGADRVTVEFEDGMESEATVIGVRPEHDLAVLQALKLPDDLPAATLRSTADLNPGDEVIAVGFPFAIGPSVSSGVISGLRRDYFSTQGKRLLTNLIQFDAAANPGNSGGPLVTTDGEVVGIVTGILNPTEQRVFIGIGFAVPIENAAAAAGLSPF